MSLDNKINPLIEKYRAYEAEYARSELKRAAPLIERFSKIATDRGVSLTQDSFSYVEKIGVIASAPELAKILLGISVTERDGLFAYDDIAARLQPSDFQEGYFSGADYMIMAHPYYRRAMYPLNNWSPLFIKRFWKLNSPDIKKYIAIDEDRVRINVDGSAYREYDTWFGAPFNKDISKIDNVIVKLKPPLWIDDIYNDLFGNVYCLDIKWSESSQIKTFQALEIKNSDVVLTMEGQDLFPARYLHAEFDLLTGTFRHFDGAVQLFTRDEYFSRRDSDFNMQLKNDKHIKARSKKVFKLNGVIPIDLWVDFCCQFFAKNPLTFEYFSGAYPDYIVDILNKIQKHP